MTRAWWLPLCVVMSLFHVEALAQSNRLPVAVAGTAQEGDATAAEFIAQLKLQLRASSQFRLVEYSEHSWAFVVASAPVGEKSAVGVLVVKSGCGLESLFRGMVVHPITKDQAGSHAAFILRKLADLIREDNKGPVKPPGGN